ncbi:hypothetical protein SEA_SPIKEBT_61 [Mycobacterium phage SpikeBT]|uniref:HNH endonuclease n=1 Tax=Mycobacterium phage Bruns TaxID=2902905 RepID=G8I612_9CAUD|nr:HNH endonuclease [Mycobacterium phage Bruns]AVJ49713.1 hypothetical protein SEA_FORSYTHEAST_64 [Mycobacterium phage Forsytheast]AVP41825.1 HNH endonuclease [Mycobacterium phage GageAP]AXH45233.1 HNH endonuclease [Mycobacterium phage SwissCheese]AXH46197.1 HNH endonuclease [Mycobacterium phage Moose]AXH69395.1 hypothetical protein SEA_NEHALO_60 [Mycobacterium phage NEHalo]QAY03842.1 HNH endonuclease [Mycobacterium phage AFIS]QAY04360.1 hypothetical protein SEA_SPIKEBT_61 [Mycobacterium pha
MTDIRPLPGFPGYFVSNSGRVFKELKEQADKKDYRYFALKNRSGTRKKVQASRAVLSAFQGPPFPGAEAAHLDGDPSHNCSRNLAWKTHVDNEKDKLRHGTAVIGEKSHLAKLTDEQATEALRMCRAGEGTLQQIADRFGVTKQAIWALKEGRSRKNVLHNGADPSGRLYAELKFDGSKMEIKDF